MTGNHDRKTYKICKCTLIVTKKKILFKASLKRIIPLHFILQMPDKQALSIINRLPLALTHESCTSSVERTDICLCNMAVWKPSKMVRMNLGLTFSSSEIK